MSKKRKRQEPGIDQDDNFAYIAGYTPGGFPYGITWAEQAEIDRREREGGLPEEDEEPEGEDFVQKEAEKIASEGCFDEVDITDLPF